MSQRPLSDTARRVVRAISERGDPRYGAYLLDLVRVGFSSAAADDALEALAVLSGIDRTGRINDEYLSYGDWVLHVAPAPGSDYAPSRPPIYSTMDPDFVPLIEQVDDARVLAGLQWGGVGVGAIGELNDPVRLPVTAAAWAKPDEQVFGLIGVRGTAVAFPERILARHELANDTLDSVPVAVTFCTLCRAVRVYDRRVDGRALTFRTSGLLLASNKVMVDGETGSLWQQYSGAAVAGPLKGRVLTPLDVEVTTWQSWLIDHPSSVVVDLPRPTVIDGETGAPIGYDYQPDLALAHYYSNDALWYPVASAPDLDPKSEVATVVFGNARLAVSVEALAEQGPMVFRVGDHLVAAVPVARSVQFFDASDSGLSEGPFSAAIDHGVIDRFARIPSMQSFWFAWYGEHPDTNWWPRTTP